MNKIKTFILVLFFLIICGCSKGEYKEYTNEFHYFDSDINIKIYTTSYEKASVVFSDIEDIYKKYENITNRDNSNSEVSKIKNKAGIKLSNEMNNLIKYSKDLYNDSDKLLSINTGDIVDLWKISDTVPDSSNIDTSLDKLVIKNGKLTNKMNLYFDNYIKGYTNKLVKEYLDSMNIDYYFINTGNEVLVGSGIDDEDYIVLIGSPFSNNVLKSFSVQNKYIVTKSIYYNSYKIGDEIYSNIVDAKDKTMASNMISVTVSGDDIYTTELVANMLFINDYYDGIDIANEYNVDAIWCYMDKSGNEIIKSNMD